MKARATGYRDSNFSNQESYEKGGSPIPSGYEVVLQGDRGDAETVYVQINDDPTWYYANLLVTAGFMMNQTNIPNAYQKVDYLSIAIPNVTKIRIGTSDNPTSYRGPKYNSAGSTGDFANLTFTSTGSSNPAYATTEITLTQNSIIDFIGND